MLFSNFKLNEDQPLYIQINNYLKDMIQKGLIPNDSKLPSTRELSQFLNISRNSVISTYDELKSQGLIYSIAGKGTFVKFQNIVNKNISWNVNFDKYENEYSKIANELDIVKNEIPWSSDLISFKSISPEGKLFDMENFKKSFLNMISLEEHKLLNYGYAQGYKPLIDFLLKYMENKGINTSNKNILITNGFTEGFDILMSAFTKKGDTIICENPTHNTSIKIMKTHKLNILGVDIDNNGLDFDMLESVLYDNSNIKFAYLTPSYHNPTGCVMSPEGRYVYYNIMRKNNIAIIEDGFNEELLYNSSHLFPICSLDNNNNGVIYLGSFSKILFPGLRIGWIFADSKVIEKLESVKRCKNIHTSFLDQAILYEYLKENSFDKYIYKIKKVYGRKFNFAYECTKKYIPCEYISGDGGLHLFIKFKDVNTRELLEKCYKNKVIFMPGDLFSVNGKGEDTLRLGFSRLSLTDIEKGIKIIGKAVKDFKQN